MANITRIAAADGAVVASLQVIPGGGLRLNFDMAAGSRAAGPSRSAFERYPISFELDASKLRALNFTQQELADIGFGLVSRLVSMVKYDA